ncbi:MAG TPA: MFS transporter, partial [Solirubrobacteraceae bacterium]
RAKEPVLPPSLLRDRVFAVAGSLSAIVGFALFGSVTFLPLYFQTVDAASPTGAGLRLVPMMVGVLTMSIFSGQVISRTGRYRRFPIVGTVLMTCGLALLSRLDVGTSAATAALFLLVLGLGLGSVMQVLVLAVQNAVAYEVLGAATSGVTMLRGIGGSLGTAIFGTIFSTQLADQLKGGALANGSLGSQIAHGARLTGAQVAKLPPLAQGLYQHAYVHALRPVFVAAAAIAALGFLLSLLLQERTLRDAAATSTGLEDSLAAPRAPDSLAEIERALTQVTSAEQRQRFNSRVAERAGIDLSPGATWALVRIDEHGFDGARQLAQQQDGITDERINEVTSELRGHGLLVEEPNDEPSLTQAGKEHTELLVQARQQLLAEALADDTVQRDPRATQLLRRLARELSGEPPVAPAAVSSPA